MSRASFGKREREQAKREKANNKRERRQRAAEDTATDSTENVEASADDVSTADLLQMIEDVHRRHADGEMTDDDFEAKKAELLGRLRVD